MSEEREITIFGQVYRVKGVEERRLAEVAEYVNRMMTRLLGSAGPGLSTRGAVLTALNIADEWLAYKAETEKTFSELMERVDELLGILPKS